MTAHGKRLLKAAITIAFVAVMLVLFAGPAAAASFAYEQKGVSFAGSANCAWGACSRTCGGGTQSDGCGHTRSCNTAKCSMSWPFNDAGPCSGKRDFFDTYPSTNQGPSSICANNSKNTACNVYQIKYKLIPESGRGNCKVVSVGASCGSPNSGEASNNVCTICAPSWTNWSACSGACGGETQTRTDGCGQTESRACNTQSCYDQNTNGGAEACDGIDNDNDGRTDENACFCTGPIDGNAQLISSRENKGVQFGQTLNMLVSANTSRKCESICKKGFAKIGDTCVPIAGAGKVNGVCGSNAAEFAPTATDWPSGDFCHTGILKAVPAFPAKGREKTWQCGGLNKGSSASCTAYRRPSAPGRYACTGTKDPNSTSCIGDAYGLSANRNWALIDSQANCSPAKCESFCNSGYIKDGNTCRPPATGVSIISISNPGTIWQAAPFDINFVVDFGSSPSGATQYRIDDGPWSAFGAGLAIPINTDGNHRVDYNFCNSANSCSSGTAYAALDSAAPVVQLMGPADNAVWNASYNAVFGFSVSDASSISSCSLKVNGADVNTLSSVSKNVQQTIRYTFPQDALADWSISCTDARGNSAAAAERSIQINMSNYQITGCSELQEMNLDLAGNYALMNDVDCSDTINWNGGAGFEPIGKYVTTDQNFRGSFEGNNHAISGLYINRPTAEYAGLFGYALNSTIRNVGLVGNNIRGKTAVGGLVALNKGGAITGAYATGKVSGGNFTGSAGTGGLVGLNDGGAISGSYTTGDTNGDYYTGGLVGMNMGGNVSNCYASGDTNGRSYTGGLIGFTLNGTVSNNYAAGDTNGAGLSGTGGLIGTSHNATMANNYATGSAWAGNGGHVGGLIGEMYGGTLKYSFATGRVKGGNAMYSRGLLGQATMGAAVTNCYWDINRTAQSACCGVGSSCASCFGANGNGLDPDRWYPQESLGGDYGAPMQHNASSAYDWTFGTDKNWTKRTNNYPVLEWQS